MILGNLHYSINMSRPFFEGVVDILEEVGVITEAYATEQRSNWDELDVGAELEVSLDIEVTPDTLSGLKRFFNEPLIKDLVRAYQENPKNFLDLVDRNEEELIELVQNLSETLELDISSNVVENENQQEVMAA